ncbi:SIR2 family protein [Achromobacter xylosoxidans]|uniref:SIR2 family protein n=1 Tax=Alcaligenes xylosoxydans xylosoxydans TaxID=85698 RepID=UPI0006C85E71|nr:SIR2 family protein [Achromobacter xylosoxidans]MCH4577249.1 SIR2 family protein [Achromobacter xylosoxidans]MDD7990432.1 SIR2 family protein [Achromobacter xylosoxidans]NEV06160.1 SIR2 family protein [Achromobacter xylosoxidans]OFO59359.1 hypothetical protein HMPREF3024_27575 [Achromobacter xylosoxidans]OMG80379.1 hypothetical protein BIZ53_30995 [Achromobacter xylosoxidans]
MQVLTYRNGGAWREVKNPQEDGNGRTIPDPALAEIDRNLSDCFRCTNLVVLTGLGTSLHVNVLPKAPGESGPRAALPGKRIAPTMADLWNACKANHEELFEKVIALTHFPAAKGGNIEALLSHCKIAEEFLGDGDNKALVTGFIATAEQTVRDCVRFLDVEDDVGLHADFLRRLVRRSTRKLRTKVFTTNYDLCFEYAARKGRYVIVDGFSHTTPQVFDSLYFSYDIVKRESSPDSHDFIPNVFHLYKLHGSVDWTRNKNSGEIEKAPTSESPLLIYPRNTKYELSFEQPYLEMMSAFQTALRQPDTGLLVLGFGFNDNHLAEPILSAINSNLHLKVVVCDPGLGPWEHKEKGLQDGNDAKHPYLSKLRYLIEHGDARLALISATFEQAVPLMPDIAAETDLEQHYERIRLMREAG